MNSLKKILVPTNLSMESLSVIQYALHQFKGYAFEITLLNILPLPDSISDLLMLPRQSEETERIPDEFSAAISRLRLLFPLRLAEVNIEHQYGISSSILDQVMEEKQIDLILHCRPQQKIKLSAAEEKLYKLLDESSYPVVYIPERPTSNQLKNISFIIEEDSNSVGLLKEMLEHLYVDSQTEVKLLAALDIAKVPSLIQQFKSVVKSGKLFGTYRFSIHIMQDESYEESILHFTEDFDIDMVFLLKKKTFLKRYMLNKHILSQTLKQSRIPLFTIA